MQVIPRQGRSASGRSNYRRWGLFVLFVATTALVPGLVHSSRTYKFVYNGQPIVTTQGDPDEIFLNCYYGDDGNGSPTGVSSLQEGEGDCAQGTTEECIGTMQECDCYVEFGDTNGCP